MLPFALWGLQAAREKHKPLTHANTFLEAFYALIDSQGAKPHAKLSFHEALV
jgi:hypothetical protein